jgi:DNA-directed RNA polymerase specialized sigma24 family protein
MSDSRDFIEHVYETESQRILGYIRRHRSELLEGEDPEDLLHDAFAKALLNPNVWCSADDLVRWLYTVVRNRVADSRNKGRRRRRIAPRIESGEQQIAELLADARIDISKTVTRQLICEYVFACARRLPVAQRGVFIATVIDGSTIDEAWAADPSVSRNTIVWRKHAATRRVRRMLREFAVTAEDIE